MHAALIARWNRRVWPEDTVYHLGGFALGPKAPWPEYRRQLNGKIVFILGNHDAPLNAFQQVLTVPRSAPCVSSSVRGGTL